MTSRVIKLVLPLDVWDRLDIEAGRIGIGKSMLAQRLLYEGLVHDSYMADIGRPRTKEMCAPMPFPKRKGGL